MSLKLDMNRAVCLHALLGIFAGAIFSSSIRGSAMNFEAKYDCNLLGSIEKSLATIARTIHHGILILAIKFLHCLISRCVDYKTTAPYTVFVPFWVAFTLSVSYMSELSLS